MRPSDVPRLWGSHARLTADTGWTPSIPLEQTVDDLLGQLELHQPWPGWSAEGPRGRAGTPRKRVALPEGWLDSRSLEGPAAAMIRQAELSVSGG